MTGAELIGKEELDRLAQPLKKNRYGQYLLDLTQQSGRP